MTTMTAVYVAADDELTALDRCDRCGAQAYVRATISAGELLFCSHHFREHSPRLLALHAHIHNELQRLEVQAKAKD